MCSWDALKNGSIFFNCFSLSTRLLHNTYWYASCICRVHCCLTSSHDTLVALSSVCTLCSTMHKCADASMLGLHNCKSLCVTVILVGPHGVQAYLARMGPLGPPTTLVALFGIKSTPQLWLLVWQLPLVSHESTYHSLSSVPLPVAASAFATATSWFLNAAPSMLALRHFLGRPKVST